MSWFKTAVERDLLPLLPRAYLNDYMGTETARNVVASHVNNTALKCCPFGAVRYELTLSRPTAFKTHTRGLVQLYCTLIGQAKNAWNGPLIEVSGLAMRRLVATSILPAHVNTVVETLDYLSTWAEETYEGRRVAAAIVIDGERDGDGPDLKEIFALDCCHIISDGVDSWLAVGRNGKLLVNPRPQPIVNDVGFYPYRYKAISEETLHPNTVAAALNRNGEILVFAKGDLVFAKRRGAWRHFDHDEVISALSTGGNNPVKNREAVYRSCLDASFARCGAGCAIIPNSSMNTPRLRVLISGNDRIDTPLIASTPTKSILLRKLIAGQPFGTLTRHFRRELVGIDGSTVVSASGTILAVGAILTVGAGSPGGGGRKAAAVAASKLGVAMKVSADGKISGFVGGNSVPVFEVG